MVAVSARLLMNASKRVGELCAQPLTMRYATEMQ